MYLAFLWQRNHFFVKEMHLFIISLDGEVELDFDADQYLVGTPALGNLDNEG